MTQEPKTIEQLARDAGWIETTIKECRKGDQVLLPDKGFFGTASDGLPQVCKYPHCIENSDGETWGVGGDDRVLRAPRPESRYKPGTVVWGKDKYLTSPQMFIRRRDENRPWAGVADCDDEPDSWPHGSIEVLRVLAYPDGTTPEPGPVKSEEKITLEKIRETRKTAVDKDGIPWKWDGPAQRFWHGSNEIQVGMLRLIDATAPGYFTHWADEQEAGE